MAILAACSSQELPRAVQEFQTNHQLAGTEGKIEVLEFLWLGCPHCKDFQIDWIHLEQEIGDEVIFRSMHAPVPNWDFDARVFFALDELGMLNSGLLANYFEDRQGPDAQSLVGSPEAIRQWLKRNYGNAPKDFAATLESSAVEERLQEAAEIWEAYPLTGVPVVLVTVPQTGTTYLVQFTQASDTKQRIIELLDILQKK